MSTAKVCFLSYWLGYVARKHKSLSFSRRKFFRKNWANPTDHTLGFSALCGFLREVLKLSKRPLFVLLMLFSASPCVFFRESDSFLEKVFTQNVVAEIGALLLSVT